jgi:2-C-methyl-D-erythritol 2,4-cyclodiphosphate synthase
MTRSGIGYDLHRLAEGRKLVLGGIEVPFDKGPVGHSDGDVLSHAICDALLGAAGLGDIGTHFPDTDPKWKGVSSLLFLGHTRKLLDERRLRISHVDAVVICERPKLGPHFSVMRATLAKSLGISSDQINLKAKTNEGTGEIGRGEAIAAQAIATLESLFLPMYFETLIGRVSRIVNPITATDVESTLIERGWLSPTSRARKKAALE